MSHEELLLTTTEAAAFIGVSRWTIRRWRLDRKLPCYRGPSGRSVRFSKSDLVEAFKREGDLGTVDRLRKREEHA